MPFKPSLANSSIDADVLLFKVTFQLGNSQWYLHLFFKESKQDGHYFPVSFFENEGDDYTKGQRRLAIELLETLPFGA